MANALLEYIVSIWTYTCITIVVFICFWIELFLLIITYPFDKTRYYVGRVFRLSSVISTKSNPYWHFSIYGPVPKIYPKSTVSFLFSNNLLGRCEQSSCLNRHDSPKSF